MEREGYATFCLSFIVGATVILAVVAGLAFALQNVGLSDL